MRLSLIIFIISIIFIIMGYVKQKSPNCKSGEKIKAGETKIWTEQFLCLLMQLQQQCRPQDNKFQLFFSRKFLIAITSFFQQIK